MKQIVRIAILSGLGLSLGGFAIAQSADHAPKIPGFYNPKTRTFTTKVDRKVVSDVTTKTYTGTFKFAFTVKLDTAVPTGSELICAATAETEDEGTSNFYSENAERKASISGTTAFCDVPIPYSWALATESDDTVSLSYELVIAPTSASSDLDLVTRDHESDLPSITIPTTGATTTLTIAATI